MKKLSTAILFITCTGAFIYSVQTPAMKEYPGLFLFGMVISFFAAL